MSVIKHKFTLFRPPVTIFFAAFLVILSSHIVRVQSVLVYRKRRFATADRGGNEKTPSRYFLSDEAVAVTSWRRRFQSSIRVCVQRIFVHERVFVCVSKPYVICRWTRITIVRGAVIFSLFAGRKLNKFNHAQRARFTILYLQWLSPVKW